MIEARELSDISAALQDSGVWRSARNRNTITISKLRGLLEWRIARWTGTRSGIAPNAKRAVEAINAHLTPRKTT